MSGVRRWISLPSHRRFFEASVIPCVMLFAAGCHEGVDTPIGPTVTGTVQTTSSAAVMADADAVTTRGGPMSFTMEDTTGSGYSGECIVGSGGAGFRLKAAGNGLANTLIRFRLQEVTEAGFGGYLYNIHVEVDHQGNFRTQERVTYLASGLDFRCVLMAGDNGTMLATGPPFEVP